ncbi:MAG TPA: hypothetical protein VKB51_08860 [bacterium]|nr:hypothetical protein [bacterium]
MAHERLNCWHCGTSLEDLPLPVGRREECPHCSSSLHVCRMCEFFDRSASKMCHEPMADEVTDKEQSNFCDYFRPKAGLTAGSDQEAAAARARLEALFGGMGSESETTAKAVGKGLAAARPKEDPLFEDEPE